MKQFFKNMLSTSDDTSHKRVIAVSAFVVLTIMTIAHFFGAQLNDTLIITFASLCGGESVLSVFEKLQK
jgi:hypothetical protein